MTLSVFNNWYISKAKKFEVKADATQKSTVLLTLNVYDELKIDATPDQWAQIIDAVSPLVGDKKGSAPRSDDDY